MLLASSLEDQSNLAIGIPKPNDTARPRDPKKSPLSNLSTEYTTRHRHFRPRRYKSFEDSVVMAGNIRRLANIGSSTPLSNYIISKKKHTPDFRALPLFHGVNRHHFSVCPVDRFGHKLGSDDDGAGIIFLEFQKWNNGGGTFHKSAQVDPTTLIEIGAIVHSNAVLSAHVHIGSGAVIGPAVTIGQSTKIGYNVSLGNCTIGDSCIIHNGVCIGQDGFGFFVDENRGMSKKPQILNARIGNHVEIGANTCIDRGSWRDTVIGDHSKIDNLVQIAHNVVIGKNCMLCGQVGIAGSVTMGDYVTLGGRVAVRDHVSIGSKVRLAGNSCVTKNIEEPGDYGGFPAVPIHEWRRQVSRHSRTVKKGDV